MRDISREVGLALGAIYYHFPSKGAFVGAYYERSHEEHLIQLGDFLNQEKSFIKRLDYVVRSKIAVADPHKNLARALFRVAANPQSPLSPFSKESKRLRMESLNLFKEVVENAEDRFHPDVKAILPDYLWLYQMGLILFWVHDESTASKRTYKLIDKSVPLIGSINRMTSSRVATPIRKAILGILKEFKPNLGDEKSRSYPGDH